MDFSNKYQTPKPVLGTMDVDEILEKYGLTRDTATKYIDAITRQNQTQTAEELQVSRDTINRYKKAFARMNSMERHQLIATLTTDKILQNATDNQG